MKSNGGRKGEGIESVLFAVQFLDFVEIVALDYLSLVQFLFVPNAPTLQKENQRIIDNGDSTRF